MKVYFLPLVWGLSFLLMACQNQDSGHPASFQKWHRITLDFEGPRTSEQAEVNPFTDYRLLVTFRNGNRTMVIPGFFAADGMAAETGADAGAVWRVHFTPDTEGEWTYEASFRTGPDIAVNDDPSSGEPVFFDGASGKFMVVPTDKSGRDFRSAGRLKFTGERYLQFVETGEYFIKGGADSPENLLAYADFDGTYDYETPEVSVKTYETHISDWREGDPVWQGSKGKGLIGALNYLAGQGMNAVYFLANNIEGDGKDVWPYTSHQDFTRFDCSKLDQWEIIFSHADSLGISLQFVTQETENERLLDDGDTGRLRKLYYRELIARFAHHPGVVWNLGEENGPADFSPNGQTDEQRKAMASWFKSHDPYQNPLVIHTHSWEGARDPIIYPLLGYTNLDGLSLQTGNPYEVHRDVRNWLMRSDSAGHPWIIMFDETGPHYQGVLPDNIDPRHDTIRQEVLWGALMAGAGGVEWYFGGKYPENDLSCQNWRSRENMWKQTRLALDFFRTYLPFEEMEPGDDKIRSTAAYCLTKPGECYAVYLKKGVRAELDLSDTDGTFSVQWYDPRNGGKLQSGSVTETFGGSSVALGDPPADPQEDWVVWVKRIP